MGFRRSNDAHGPVKQTRRRTAQRHRHRKPHYRPAVFSVPTNFISRSLRARHTGVDHIVRARLRLGHKSPRRAVRRHRLLLSFWLCDESRRAWSRAKTFAAGGNQIMRGTSPMPLSPPNAILNVARGGRISKINSCDRRARARGSPA